MGTDTVTNSAREDVLRRVRTANGRAADGLAAKAGWETISRTYQRTSALGREATLERFEDRLRDYDARVKRATGAEVAHCVAEMLADRGVRRVVVPWGFPKVWLPEGVEFMEDEDLAASVLDRTDGVITGATVGIAETGTVVLQNAPGQGRRMATLVPDYHLCVVRTEDVVATVSEAISRLEATSMLPTTFISGPSATADIEMTRIKGVHGPRFLDVVLVFGEDSPEALK